MKNRFKLSDFIALIVMFLIGMGLVIINSYSMSQYEPNIWKPTIIGTIVTSKIVIDDGYFIPHIEYAYTINGNSYKKSAMERLVLFRDAEGARVVIANYPVGSEVPIYFRAGHPNNSILQSGIGVKFNATRTMLVVASFGMLIMIVIVYSFIHSNSYTVNSQKVPPTDPLLPKVDDLPPY